MILHKAVVKSPVGRLILVAKDDAVVGLAFGEDDHNARRWLERRFGQFEMKAHRDPAGAVSALRAYFKGDLAAIDRVKVDTGGTEFQRAVWSELRRIPAGSTDTAGPSSPPPTSGWSRGPHSGTTTIPASRTGHPPRSRRAV